MQTKPRFFLPDMSVHIVQRGHSREPVFFEDGDYQAYLDCLAEAAGRYKCMTCPGRTCEPAGSRPARRWQTHGHAAVWGAPYVCEWRAMYAADGELIGAGVGRCCSRDAIVRDSNLNSVPYTPILTTAFDLDDS